MDMLIPPATLRAAAAMHRPEIKWKLVHKLEAAHHSDRSLQLSKETFIDLVLDTMAASANTQALLGIEADDVRHAAEIVFDTKLALNAPHADSPITVRAATESGEGARLLFVVELKLNKCSHGTTQVQRTSQRPKC